MDISELADYILDYIPDQNNLLFLLVVLGFLGFNLNLRAYCRRRKQIKNVRRIVHDGVSTILDDNPMQEPMPFDGINAARYRCFKIMISNLEVVLNDHSSVLPYEIKKDVRHLCTNIDETITSLINIVGHENKEFYERHVVDKLRKFKWLKLKL